MPAGVIGPLDPDPQRRRIPAGQVLMVMLVGFAVAIVLNIDNLVDNARQNNPVDSTRREVELAAWEPIEDVSKALWLHQPVKALDNLLGKGDEEVVDVEELVAEQLGQGDGDSPADEGGDEGEGEVAEVTTTTVGPPDLRIPTPAEPLRLWVGGDSMSQVFGESLVRMSNDTGVIAPALDFRVSAGLTRPDAFDWPLHFYGDVLASDPEVLVMMFGANDSQGIVDEAGNVHERGSEGFLTEYRRRVAATMDLVKDPDGDRLVVWVGQPRMRPGSNNYDARMRALNDIYESEAKSRPWVVFLDSEPMFADANDAYNAYLPGVDGNVVNLRQNDGIHLSRAGGDKLAARVLEIIREWVDLDGAVLAP